MSSSQIGTPRASLYRSYSRGKNNGSSSENLPPRTINRVAREIRDLHKSPPDGVSLVVDADTGVPASLGEVLVSRCHRIVPQRATGCCRLRPWQDPSRTLERLFPLFFPFPLAGYVFCYSYYSQRKLLEFSTGEPPFVSHFLCPFVVRPRLRVLPEHLTRQNTFSSNWFFLPISPHLLLVAIS